MTRRCDPRTVIVAACVAGALVGCGAPTEGTRAIASEDVPYGLLSPSPKPTPTTAEVSPGSDDVSATVYFVGLDDLLVPVPIAFRSHRMNDLVTEVLNSLQAGPSEADRAVGLGTALGTDIELRLATVVGTTVYVDLVLSTRQPAADQIPLAVGQIVLSVTSLSGVTHVGLLVDGEEVDVPLPGGQRTVGSVTAADYGALVETAPRPT